MIKEPLNLYKKQPSQRPEVNDAWQKPFAAELKFPAWPEPQPIVHPAKPMRPPGAKRRRGASDLGSSHFEDVDLAEVDINDLGKMLNPEENLPSKMKRGGSDRLDANRAGAGEPQQESSVVDLVKP